MLPEQESLISELKKLFLEKFSQEPILTIAPGRINLLGEHTDYNDGFVLPAAIDKAAFFALSASEKPHQVHFIALDLGEEITIDLSNELRPIKGSWVNYFLGILSGFQKNGIEIPSINCMFRSNVPLGAGLSSSAAIECGFAYALNALTKSDFSKMKIAQLGQQAEHEFAGVMCGIMDQFASCFGADKKAIELDCRDLTYKYHDANFEGYSWILFDSQVKHNLASSEYNVRREQCESGVKALRKINPDITSLRDVSLPDLDKIKSEVDAVIFQRCQYVIEENERVKVASEALDKSDPVALGKLMFETHNGLQNLYEVSCDELDFMVAEVRENPAVAGARMMGGGFGGCTINLVKEGHLAELKEKMAIAYKQKFNVDLKSYEVRLSEGVRVVSNLDG